MVLSGGRFEGAAVVVCVYVHAAATWARVSTECLHMLVPRRRGWRGKREHGSHESPHKQETMKNNTHLVMCLEKRRQICGRLRGLVRDEFRSEAEVFVFGIHFVIKLFI